MINVFMKENVFRLTVRKQHRFKGKQGSEGLTYGDALNITPSRMWQIQIAI